ncbi:hypothetical protein LTR10_023128 [Elasticomyces elasticus]|uniref:Uncharacterized protein n=1 Tax=Exophiala sideris TaxID=1016849 RepID=A0ABR0J1T0_9EURO|nr:hypothetical protein LTR10_023128 [Elasticomyces elasticus]KAK5024444.1 hypothetical protein LTS07_008735 [Exophiala sideris]KAK5030874.1 hypothetical protein LTR13_007887 [Exophiala sideris]KAK5054177.1 hypothetical protein LTR69_009139 [Exophiala sideris]KAK5179467.1 hypothetical protein LTR44_007983 [Eurotiomycetes sp. CCFEE 6388]
MSYDMDKKQFQDPDSGQPVSVQEIEHTLRWIPPPPQYKQFPGIPRPVTIPQIQPNSLISGPMPFTRAFAACLLPHTITPEQFVAFIDNYAVAAAPSPAFQGMQLVGTGIGFVPHHWAQAASGAIGFAAGAGTQVVAAARTKLYLKKVNEDFFNRRGLRASVVGDDDLRNITREDPRQPPLVPADASAGVTTLAERRLKALERYIAPLSFDVPPPEAQTNTLDKLSAKQVNAKIKKNREKALKQARKHGGSDFGQTLSPGDYPGSRSRSGSRSSFDDRYALTTEQNNFASYPSRDPGFPAAEFGNPPGYSPRDDGYSPRDPGYASKGFEYSSGGNPYPQNNGYPPRHNQYPQDHGYPLRDNHYLQGAGYPSRDPGYRLRDSGYPPEDPAYAETESKKIRELTLKMQEINLKAEREMIKEDKDSKRDKIDRERRKKISEVQDKIDKEMRHGGHDRGSSDDFGGPRDHRARSRSRDRSKNKKRRDSSAEKAEGKDFKAAGKLKWIVIQNL